MEVLARSFVPPRGPLYLSALLLSCSACGLRGSGGGPADGGAGAESGPDAAAAARDASPDGTHSAAGPRRLRVVSWNVRNLFDATDDPATYDDVPTLPQLRAKLQAIGTVLGRLDADIVLLQEVENRRVLDELADGPLADAGYVQRYLFEGHDPRGIDVAALCRLPVERVASHLDERFPSPDGSGTRRFARDLLELFVRVGDGTLVVATTHFRSQRDGADADHHRLAEATQVQRIVARRIATGHPWFLLAGDLNDTPGSPALQALQRDGVLQWLLGELPPSERWSYRAGRHRALIDHALATGALRSRLRGLQVRFERNETVWSTSDHAPLVIDLAF